MELISIFRQTLAARRRPMLFFTAGLAAAGLALLMLGAWPWLQRWMERLPEGWQAFLGLSAGWTGMAGFGWIFPLLLGWFAVRQGSDLIAGEEERGALALLLVGAVRPAQLVWIRWFALIVLTLFPTAALGVVLLAGGMAGAGVATRLMGMLLALWLFGVLCGSLALLAGCLSGRERLGLLAGGLTLGLGIVLDRLAEVFPAIRFLHFIIPYGWYGGPHLQNGLWLPGILLLTAASVICAFGAAAGFAVRDLSV